MGRRLSQEKARLQESPELERVFKGSIMEESSTEPGSEGRAMLSQLLVTLRSEAGGERVNDIHLLLGL